MAGVNGGVLRKAMWLYPKVSGFSPSERWGHSACYCDGVVYVYGGCCGGMHFSDVLALDLKTMVWSTLATVGNQPGTRDSHSMVLVGNRVIILGGTNGSKKINDLHILDLKTKEWNQPTFEGEPPSPRESHTATAIGDDKLVIFGGSGEGEGNYLNDVHILDLKNMKWTSPVVKGELPAPRDSHTAVAIENKLIVYGGDCGDRYLGDVDILDIDSLTWSRLMIDGPSPGPRAGHATVTIDSKVYVIGGVGDRQYYNDVWFLDLSGHAWSQLDIGGQQPQGRFSHSAVVADSDIAIYGGCGEDERPLSELLILQLGSEHPNGRYNISMCKIFGKQWSHNKQRASASCRNDLMHVSDSSEKEAASLHVSSEASPLTEKIQAKRRRTSQSRLLENSMDLEERSPSLSQQSSPSQSDQEQRGIKPDRSSPPAGLFRQRKLIHNQSNNLMHHQIQQRSSLPRTNQNGQYISIGLHGQPKAEQLLYVSQNGRPDVPQTLSDQMAAQKITASKVIAIPNLIGAEVQGIVDGAFDSGFLMTANVNGQIFRGILFSPGPGFVAREATPVVTPVVLGQPALVSIPQGAVPIPNSTSVSTTVIRPVQIEAIRQPINFVLPSSRGNLPENKEDSDGSRAVNFPSSGRDTQLRPLIGTDKMSCLEENRKVPVPYTVRPARAYDQSQTTQTTHLRAPPIGSPRNRRADLQGVVLSLGAPGIGRGGS